jgi:hypothetical protein
MNSLIKRHRIEWKPVSPSHPTLAATERTGGRDKGPLDERDFQFLKG